MHQTSLWPGRRHQAVDVLHVPTQLARGGQSSVAHATRHRVRLLAGVLQHVPLQLRARDGAEPALLAKVRPLAAVDPQVCLLYTSDAADER